MNIKQLAEHSFDVDLFTPGGLALDVGCRYFAVARELKNHGLQVVAMEPDPKVQRPPDLEVTFVTAALGAEKGKGHLAMWGNGTGNYLTSVHSSGPLQTAQVDVLDLAAISHLASRTHTPPETPEAQVSWSLEPRPESTWGCIWDAIKLDCEGAEYDILLGFDRPWAKQVSVEFHEHTVKPPQGYYERMLKVMGQWYDVFQMERTSQHGCGFNYWDVLFVRKDLV